MSLTAEQFDQWTTILRTQPERQIRGRLGGPSPQPCCAQGALVYDVLGLPEDDDAIDAYRVLDAVLEGVDGEVESLNDIRRLTFPQIADWLDEYRAKTVVAS